jgi:hypothetical protein
MVRTPEERTNKEAEEKSSEAVTRKTVNKSSA